MSEDTTLTVIRSLVRDLSQGAELDDETPLIERRIIDSLSLLRLVAKLEEEFHITIRDTEIRPSHFATTRAIRDFVATKAGS
ncbi:acyl carrier protein [Kitasatospora sp. NPDC096128]|uniref:acyl carrier protein n=1 Tax=Kitasatospora sp. NPDC096128 TaxID=3155547 RepID=UPI0033293905